MWGGNRLGGHAADTLNLGCCHDACLSSAFLTVVDAGDAFAPPTFALPYCIKLRAATFPLIIYKQLVQCNVIASAVIQKWCRRISTLHHLAFCAMIFLPQFIKHRGGLYVYYKASTNGRQAMSRIRHDIDSLAAIYRRAGMIKRGDRVYQCGLFMLEVTDEMGVNYIPSYQCGERLCPRCARSRSLRIAANAADVAAYLRQAGTYRTPYHVVLTVRNVVASDLRAMIDVMIAACRWLLHRRSIWRSVAGWGRSIEITYNALEQTYHPHVHLLVVPTTTPDPDTVGCADWWSKQWAAALSSCGHDVDYMPICHTEAAYSDGVLPEVSKYITKLGRIYALPYDARFSCITIIDEATRGRKLVSYGGIWASARRALRQRDDIDADNDTAVQHACSAVILKWSGLEYVPVRNT